MEVDAWLSGATGGGYNLSIMAKNTKIFMIQSVAGIEKKSN